MTPLDDAVEMLAEYARRLERERDAREWQVRAVADALERLRDKEKPAAAAEELF